MNRLSALVYGLGNILNEAWESICCGSLGSTLWLYQRHSKAVFDGLVMAIK